MIQNVTYTQGCLAFTVFVVVLYLTFLLHQKVKDYVNYTYRSFKQIAVDSLLDTGFMLSWFLVLGFLYWVMWHATHRVSIL